MEGTFVILWYLLNFNQISVMINLGLRKGVRKVIYQIINDCMARYRKQKFINVVFRKDGNQIEWASNISHFVDSN